MKIIVDDHSSIVLDAEIFYEIVDGFELRDVCVGLGKNFSEKIIFSKDRSGLLCELNNLFFIESLNKHGTES